MERVNGLVWSAILIVMFGLGFWLGTQKIRQDWNLQVEQVVSNGELVECRAPDCPRCPRFRFRTKERTW